MLAQALVVLLFVVIIDKNVHNAASNLWELMKN